MLDNYLHRFVVREKTWIYDMRSNRIFQSKSDGDEKLIRKDLDSFYRQKYGLSIDDIVFSQVRYPNTDDEIRREIKTEAKQLILSLTDNCNFRCGYCVYGGCYEGMRQHRDVDMPDDVSRKAINEFATRSRHNGKDFVISFYGGEPLLRWPTIKELIEYTKKGFGKHFRSNMTTNGWLLTPDKFEFLVSNNFMLCVSLDGPKEIHDRYRKLNGDKDGLISTYDGIMDNLKKLKEFNPNYYNRNVVFSCVIVNPLDMNEIEKSFLGNPLTKNHSISAGSVRKCGTTLLIPQIDTPEKKKKLKEDSESIINSFKKHLCGKGDSALGVSLFASTVRRIRERERELINGTISTNGICVPGTRRLFVTTDGKYHPCEKSEDLNVGNVYNGIDENSVIRLIRDYESMSDGYCNKCWAVRLCSSCFAISSKNGELNHERLMGHCQEIKATIDLGLKIYTELTEDGVDLTGKVNSEEE